MLIVRWKIPCCVFVQRPGMPACWNFFKLGSHSAWPTFPPLEMIKHPSANSSQILRRMLPELRSRGYRVVSLSELVGAVSAKEREDMSDLQSIQPLEQ